MDRDSGSLGRRGPGGCDLIGGGVQGRLAASDITLFKDAGGGHLHLMTAQAIMSRLDAEADA